MPEIDELQRHFDAALAELPASSPPPISKLYGRLHRRQIKLRLSGLAGLAVVVVAGLGVGLTGSPSQPAGAVMLRATGPNLSHRQLLADAAVMRKRLADFGSTHAHVSVSGHTIVVSGGPSQLTDPTSALTASPELLVRPVLCVSGPYQREATGSDNSLPSTCAETPYAIPMAIPTPGGTGSSPKGYSESNQLNDPALAGIPSTSVSQDATNPRVVALLPVADSGGARYLVGPTQLTLSSKVASADVVQSPTGIWVVDIQLTSSAATQWDRVAFDYFHLVLGVDLNGQIVTAPLIEPAQTAYTSFNGKMELSGFGSKAAAQAVAAALQSGPLPTPLRVG